MLRIILPIALEIHSKGQSPIPRGPIRSRQFSPFGKSAGNWCKPVFGIDLGRQSRRRTCPLSWAITILSAVLIVAANLVVDLCHALLDPRVRLE